MIRSQANSSGAILVLVALLLFIILSLAALSIDVTIALSAHEQARQHARVAVLTAMEQYYASLNSGSSHTQAMQDAVERTNTVLTTNALFTGGGHEDNVPQVSVDVSDDAARLIAGVWKTGESETCDSDVAPCFSPLTDEEITNEGKRPSAFRIQGKLYRGIPTRIAEAVFGVSLIDFEVAATATFVPRVGCFLIDLSPSVAYETHIPWKDGGPFAEEPGTPSLDEAFGNRYAFITQDDNPHLTFPFSPMDNGWAELSSTDVANTLDDRNGAPYVSTKHFASDYTIQYVLADEDHPGEINDENNPLYRLSKHFLDPSTDPDRYSVPHPYWARVDGYLEEDGTQHSPEPFGTFIRGVHEALQTFKDRHVSGDQACLIFFDRTTPWTHVVKLTSDFDFLIELTNLDVMSALRQDVFHPENPDDYTDPKDYILENGLGEGRERLNRLGIFPQRFAHTDIRTALDEAFSQLSSEVGNGVPSSHFITLITDGLQNCHGQGFCNNLYSHYRVGIAEVKAKIAEYASQERPVPIHVILSGDQVGPHTIDMTNPEPPEGAMLPIEDGHHCYTDEEYRQLPNATEYRFVEGGNISNDTEGQELWDNRDTTPFYQPNADLYEVAVVTRGLFGPLRRRDNAFCESILDESHDHFDPKQYRPLCDPVADPANPDHRRETDPYCRTKEQQMRDYMSRIVGANPFTVVEVN
ncbi:MAG: hypothetical protein KDD55_00305 [Bdellovibrionales bacterium]|nr:hypothetical protein [Bdellovibrionales bacterium]